MFGRLEGINGGTLTQFNMLNGISEFNIYGAGGSQQPTAQCHSLIDISECLDSISHLTIQQEAQSDNIRNSQGSLLSQLCADGS